MPQVEDPEVINGQPEADEAEPQEPELRLGELGPFDYTDQEFLELSEEEKNALKKLIRECCKRDTAARRMEVEQAWEARLFKRGYQYLLPRRGGGWYLPSPTTGFGPSRQIQQAALYETNVYGAHCDIITSALVRDIPECRFEPENPNYDPDITAADAADEFREIFSRNNDLRALHTQAADYMCTDGRVLFYTRMVLDGQRFGWEDSALDQPLVPEDETTGPPQSPNEETQQEAQEFENESPTEGQRKPRGREITDCYGKLEHKLPIQTQNINECDFCFVFRDVHVSRAKGMFYWAADKIKPGSGGIPELELDRIGRINCALALPGTYVTGDTFNQDVTIYGCWLRPSALMAVPNEQGIRDSLMAKCPDGVFSAWAGDTFCFARNENMDDHLHVLQCFPGSGQNRIALMSKVLSVQKRLNNWIDLLNDYFIRCVPMKWVGEPIVSAEAIQEQGNIPGGVRPFQYQPGVNPEEFIFVEPTPQNNPAMPEFINFFFNEYPEMLSGALPSLFGAESNTETASGISMQRDQALGRLASPWGALQSATACYMRQAVQQAARCRLKLGQTQIIGASGKDKIVLEVADLQGNILSFPDVDANFPETWVQRQSRWQTFLAQAGEDPNVQRMLQLPKNMKIAKDALGFTDLDVPEATSVDKQLGEFEILLKTGPQPNPELVQAMKMLDQGEAQAKAAGPEAVMAFQQKIPQIMQMLQSLPQSVSTIPVMQDASEDHATESQVCFDWLNSPEGRKYKRGTPEERQAWENVHLHWSEHSQMAAKLAPPPPGKPPSESMSAAIDKMPPEIASQMLAKFYGINASPQNFQVQDAVETEQKITEKAADFGRGVTEPSQENSGAQANG